MVVTTFLYDMILVVKYNATEADLLAPAVELHDDEPRCRIRSWWLA